MWTVKPELLPYLAGALDADGFVSIQRTKKLRRGCKRHGIYHLARVGIGQTNSVVPQLFLATFGGTWHEHQPKNIAHRRVYQWQASNLLAACALEQLLPYLVLKRRQAVLAIQLSEMVQRQFDRIKKTQRPPYRLPARVVAARQRIYEKVLALNQPRNRTAH